MSAAAAIRSHLLPYAGCTSVARLPDLTSTRMLSDLNAVLQQLYSGGQQENKTALIRGPATVTIENVTAQSNAITFTSGYQSYMLGCTIQITGDFRENRLVKSNGTLTLENPYMGSTGTNVTATIHFDCTTVGIEIAKIYEPMSLDRKWQVSLVDRAVIDQLRFGLDRRRIQRPIWAAVEDALDASGTPSRRILLDSLPDEAYILHFRADVRAPVVTGWDDARTALLPNGLDDSVLKPLVLMAFSSHPDFTGDVSNIAPMAQIAGQTWAASRGPGLARRQIDMMN